MWPCATSRCQHNESGTEVKNKAHTVNPTKGALSWQPDRPDVQTWHPSFRTLRLVLMTIFILTMYVVIYSCANKIELN